MVPLSSFFSFLLLIVNNVHIKPSQCTFPAHQSGFKYPDLSSLAEKWSLIKGKNEDVVNRFRCPKEWQRFGGSCYYLSNVTSPANEANQTCNLAYMNLPQLMQIRHPAEFFYAAHILVKNDLSALLIEINSRLFKDKKFAEEFSLNDQIKWQSAENRFRQSCLNYNQKMKKVDQSERKKGLHHESETEYIRCSSTESQSTAYEKNLSKKDEIDSSVDDDNSGRLDDIRKVCDRLAWNVLNDNSNVFTLTRYFMSGKAICSIDDIDPNTSYTHMCQYVLNFCFGNDICDKHGRCVNHLVGFKCSCYFWSDGTLCNKVSQKFIQLVVVLVIIFVLFICTLKSLPQYQRRAVKKIHDFYTTRFLTCDHVQDNINTTDDNSENISTSESETEKRDSRFLLVSGFTFLIICLLCIIPPAYQWNSLQLHKAEQLKFDLLVDDTIRTMTECRRKSIFGIDNNIFMFISAALCAIFLLLIISKKGCPPTCSNQSGGCLSPIEPFTISNRYETAALSGIVMIEILMALEHFLIDLSDLWNQGVLEQFRDRVLVPFLYSIRFYPIFASLQKRDRYARFFAFIYMGGNITYIIIRRSSCMDFLPVSNRFSTLIEATRRVELGTWTIIYGLIKNAPQFILLSYIGAELTVRFIYDSIYVPLSKKTDRVADTPITPGAEFNMYYSPSSPENSLSSDNSSSTSWPCIQKIYQWDKDFQFTTTAMCAYTINIVLLLYLTCIFAFQPIMETDSMSFLIFCLEQTLNIEIDEWSFHAEIIISAILTMILFGIQLYFEIKKYKKHTAQMKDNKYEEIPPESQLEKNSIAPKSVGYLGFIFLSIVGGFFIWFHIILFIVMICSLISVRSATYGIVPFEPIHSLLSFVLPLLLLYGLKSCITRWLCIFTFSDQSENGHNAVHEKVYGFLMYLTFIFSCHIAILYCSLRLIKGILFNILLMPRIDCSYLGRECKEYDSGYIAYVSYLHMENTYKPQIQTESKSLQTENAIEQPILISTNQIAVPPLTNDQDLSDSDTTLGRQSGEDDSYQSASGMEVDDSDDASSVTSSIYQRGKTITVPDASILPTSHHVHDRPHHSQRLPPKQTTRQKVDEQDSTYELKSHYSNSKRKGKITAMRHERQSLMTPTNGESSEEDDPSELSAKNYKMPTVQSEDNRFKSTGV